MCVHANGALRVDDNDLSRIRNIHVKYLRIRIVNRPAGSAGDANLILHHAVV